MARAAHPRSRGEHWDINSRIWGRPGSSPLARGTLLDELGLFLFLRLIPARAGNTWRYRHCREPRPAHPRSRGEHHHQRSLTLADVGSSPLARGTLVFSGFLNAGLRLIPARAGNTSIQRLSQCRTEAHPRSRGEHSSPLRSRRKRFGSSPLARGTRRHPNPCRRPGRLIPARAGNTTRPPDSETSGSAHPRSRGEHSAIIHEKPLMNGSSPLARGTLPGMHEIPVPSRLIPARAGNTTYHHGT